MNLDVEMAAARRRLNRQIGQRARRILEELRDLFGRARKAVELA